MGKNYQKTEIDPSAPAVPERVSVALAELAGEVREGLLALAVGDRVAGDGRDDGSRRDRGVRAQGPPRRRTQRDPPRARGRVGEPGRASGAGASAADARHRRFRGAAGGLLRGVLPDRGAGADGDGADAGRAVDPPLPGRAGAGRRAVEQAATATSRSAVSRRFVAATETALAQLLAADLSALDLVALMIDGVHFGEHCCVVALGIGIDGTKHPLSLVEGSTENATLVTELIVGLRERGLDVTRPILVVLDGRRRCAWLGVVAWRTKESSTASTR